MRIKKISAVTFRVSDMRASAQFYRDVRGMKLLYGGEDAYFSSFQAKDGKTPILNLEQGRSAADWGRMIFYVADVDAFWEYLRGKGFSPESPRDAPWGERYFHMPDLDGPRAVVCASDLTVFQQMHELIFIEEKFLKTLSQHLCAEVLSGVRFVH